jgi:TolA-binding protein
MEDRIEMMGQKIDQILTLLQELSKENARLSQQNESLTRDLQEKQKKMEEYERRINSLEQREQENRELKSKINGLEQQTRKNNIIISGVPLHKDEKVGQLVELCGRAVGVNLGPSEVDTCHRLPHKPESKRPPNIVVRLVRRDTKSNLLSKWRRKQPKLSDISGSTRDSKTSIYIAEHLSPVNATLYHKARILRKERNVQYLWTKNCKIFARIKDGDPTIKITTEEDLEKLRNDSELRLEKTKYKEKAAYFDSSNGNSKNS